jgi:RHS repeat-associated protein
LSNTLITISDNKIGVDAGTDNTADYYQATILSATDYYAFGMSMKERSWQSDSYRYGFNGKENDADWEVQDYGFRIYKPEISKFLSVDPLTQSYPWYTPYQFAGNSPVAAIDLDGLEPLWVKEFVNKFTRFIGLPEVFALRDAEDIEEVAEINNEFNRKQAHAQALKQGLEEAHEYQKQAISLFPAGAGFVTALEVGTGQKSLTDALTDQGIDQITNKVGGKVVDKVVEAGIFTKLLAIFKSPKTNKNLEIGEDLLNKPIYEIEGEALHFGNKQVYDDKIHKINELIIAKNADIKDWEELLDVQKRINGSLISELETKIKVGNTQIDRLEKLKYDIINQPIDWLDNELDKILKNK